MSVISIRLEEDLEKDLKQLCAKSGKKKSTIIKDALKRKLTLIKFELLREKMLPFGEKAGCFTDEEVFEKVS